MHMYMSMYMYMYRYRYMTFAQPSYWRNNCYTRPYPSERELAPHRPYTSTSCTHLYLKNFQPSYWRSKSYPRERQHARPIARKDNQMVLNAG